MTPSVRARTFLLVWFLSLPALAVAATSDYDGQWAATLACGAHVGNGRPAFVNKVVFTVTGGRIAHVQEQTTRMGPEQTRWDGRIEGGTLTLGAEGRRDPDARWTWQLAGKASGTDRIAGGGGLSSDGRKVRDCTVEMRLDVPAPASLHARAQPAAASPSQAVQPAPVSAPPPPAQTIQTQPPAAPAAQAASTAATNALRGAAAALHGHTAAGPATGTLPAGVPSAGARAPGVPVPPGSPGSPALASPPATPAIQATRAAQAAGGTSPSVGTSASPAKAGLSSIEQRLEAIAGNRNLDLLLMIPNGDMRGSLRRSVAGDWSLHADRLCINVGELVKSDGIQIPWSAFSELGQRGVSGDMRIQAYYQMLRFTPARQHGLREPPRAGFSGPTPTVTAGIPSRSAAPQAESDSADYRATLTQAFETALQKRFGRAVAVTLNLGGSGCSPDAVAIPRMLIDQTMGPKLSSRWKASLDAGQLHEVAVVPIAEYRVARDTRQQGIAQAAKSSDNLLRSLADSPASGAGALYGAMNIGRSTIRACYVVPDAANAPRHGASLEAILRSESFARFQPGRPSSVTKFDDIDALYADMQKRDGRCTMILGNGPTLAKLKSAVDRDRQLDGRLMPDPLDETALLRVHAASLGFKDPAAYVFGHGVGVRDAAQVSRLQALGITNAEQFASLRKRLEQVEPGAGGNVDALIQMAADEREATAKGATVKAIRAERAKQEEAEARRYAAAMAAEEKAKAAQFPFVAVFSCAVGQQKTALQACMSSGSVDTEIELRNGNDYRMYKMHDVSSMGRSVGNEMIVDLRRNFDIKAQNADRTLVMSLVVKDRTSGRVLYQRSAAQFGVMRVTN